VTRYAAGEGGRRAASWGSRRKRGAADGLAGAVGPGGMRPGTLTMRRRIPMGGG